MWNAHANAYGIACFSDRYSYSYSYSDVYRRNAFANANVTNRQYRAMDDRRPFRPGLKAKSWAARSPVGRTRGLTWHRPAWFTAMTL
jgi:hypothetical protein